MTSNKFREYPFAVKKIIKKFPTANSLRDLPGKFREFVSEKDFENFDFVKYARNFQGAHNRASIQRKEFKEIDGKSYLVLTDRHLLDGKAEGGSSSGSGSLKLECFIATAVYGDINHPSVETLRNY